MALKKVKELPSGVTGEYWKIISVLASKPKMELSVTLSLYKDKAASDAGKSSLGVTAKFSAIYDESQLQGNLLALGYEMIKSQLEGAAPSILSGKLIQYNELHGAIDA